ncbi:MAG: hypothetical protein HFH55_12335 [Lachnospiraceae bacterium]|nr:hypothetical protein [Lachnospiraceae bacterium]
MQVLADDVRRDDLADIGRVGVPIGHAVGFFVFCTEQDAFWQMTMGADMSKISSVFLRLILSYEEKSVYPGICLEIFYFVFFISFFLHVW